jgi:hypothetical protein
MEKLQKSMTVYVKSLSKRNEGDDREKMLPVAHMGQTMIHHGEDFEPDSEFGNCLIGKFTFRIAADKGLMRYSNGTYKRQNRSHTRFICRFCHHRLVRIVGEIIGYDERIPGMHSPASDLRQKLILI